MAAQLPPNNERAVAAGLRGTPLICCANVHAPSILFECCTNSHLRSLKRERLQINQEELPPACTPKSQGEKRGVMTVAQSRIDYNVARLQEAVLIPIPVRKVRVGMQEDMWCHRMPVKCPLSVCIFPLWHLP